MKTNVRKWFVVLLIATWLISACQPAPATAPSAKEVAQELATIQAADAQQVEDEPPAITPAVAVETEAPEEPAEATLTATPVNSGEGCVGPAILETVVEGKTAVIKIDKGESWPVSEGCFADQYFRGDQAFLDNRFPTHVEEFRAKYPGQDVQVLEVQGDKLAPYESVLLDAPEDTPAAPDDVPAPVVPASAAQEPGTIAWHQETSRDTWEASPIGELGSDLWILTETWGPSGAYVVLIPSGAVAWFQGHFGGTGWWLPSDTNLQDLAEEHQVKIKARDGTEAEIVVLPDQGFPLLGCLQSLAVKDGVRTCDEVGDKPVFTMKVGNPFPGYYPKDYTFTAPEPGALLDLETAPITTTLTLADFGTGLTCDGPGIVETSVSGVPAVVAVGDGEVFTYAEGGGFCGGDYFASQPALEARFPDHVTEFQVTYPEARVFVFEDGQLVELP